MNVLYSTPEHFTFEIEAIAKTYSLDLESPKGNRTGLLALIEAAATALAAQSESTSSVAESFTSSVRSSNTVPPGWLIPDFLSWKINRCTGTIAQ